MYINIKSFPSSTNEVWSFIIYVLVFINTYIHIHVHIYICRVTIGFYFWEFQALFTFRISDQIYTETSGRVLISINGCCIWTTSKNTIIRTLEGFFFTHVFLRILDLFGKIAFIEFSTQTNVMGHPDFCNWASSDATYFSRVFELMGSPREELSLEQIQSLVFFFFFIS